MSSFGRTDAVTDKPKWDYERQVEPFVELITATTASTGNTLTFSTSAVSAANIAVGMSVLGSNVGFSGADRFFESNTVVKAVTASTVELSANVLGAVPANTVITFDSNIQWKSNTHAVTYNQDTVLVTATRLANSSFANTATPHTGWVYVKTGTGGRAGRVQVEVLTAMSNVVASNTSSGNTSNTGSYYSGI